MPGKHNAGGCGCCGCFACGSPIGIVVDGVDCCTGLDGTYLFGSGGTIPGGPIADPDCGVDVNVAQDVRIFIDSASAGGLSCCFTESTVFSFSAIRICDTKTPTYFEPGLGTFSMCHQLTLQSCRIWAYVKDVSGTPKAFASIRAVYQWRANAPNGANCTNPIASPGITFYQWIYEDLYESEIDCGDPELPLTHVSRTLVSATDSTYTVADDDGFSWGSNDYLTPLPSPPSYRYDICAAPSVRLEF